MAGTIDPGADIGHVHLKVSDLERSVAFYRDVLGFEVMHRYGDDAAFLAAGGYHHHIGLNTWESKGGSPPPPGTTGLFHDHGVSEAIYLRDPDQNGIELYRDRPRVEWPDEMFTAPLDLPALLAEAQ
jgi:catechol 2,3-dioxygenase